MHSEFFKQAFTDVEILPPNEYVICFHSKFPFKDFQVKGSHLRATVCKYRESGVSREIFNFFIFCSNNLYSELFSKILLKGPEAL